MKCEYRMREDEIRDEEGELHTVYGVEAFEDGELLRAIPDVFCEKSNAERYIEMFNDLELSFLHLDDVIEDIL